MPVKKKQTAEEGYEDAIFTEGEEEARQLVARFITKLTESTEVEAGFKVKLMQCGSGSELRVDAFTYELDYSAEDFAEDVVKRAVDDIQSHRGTVKYAVRAFVGGRDRVERFRLSVPRTEAEEEDEFGEDLEEAPTRRGQIHQNMRHTEVLMREHRHGMVLVVKSLEGQIQTYVQRVKELESRLREYQDREEDVASLKWVRELETDRIKGEEERKARGLQMLQSAVPLLLGKVLDPNGAGAPNAMFAGMMGESPIPGAAPQTPEASAFQRTQQASPPPDPLHAIHLRQDLLLDSVFQAITPDHVQQLMQVLPPTVLGALSELHRCCLERQNLGVAPAGSTHQNTGNPGAQPRT